MNDKEVSVNDNELHDMIKVSCEESAYDGADRFETCNYYEED